MGLTPGDPHSYTPASRVDPDLVCLDVVVVSHGAWDLLSNCLRSLRDYPPDCPMTVTVVDSGSIDGTPDRVEESFPEVRLIRCENIGFAAANNLAILDSEAPMILLLNPDTEVGPGSLDASINAMRKDPEVGVVGVKLVTPDGRLDHACKRSFPTPVGAFAHFLRIGRGPNGPGMLRQYRAPDLPEDQAGEVDAVNGAFMLVRRESLKDVGLLDERYWMYSEDLDWCKRFWNANWKVLYEPAGTVLHVKGGTSGDRRGIKQEIAFHRGMGRFYRRYDASDKPAPLNLLVYLGIAAKLGLSLLLTGLSRLRKP